MIVEKVRLCVRLGGGPPPIAVALAEQTLRDQEVELLLSIVWGRSNCGVEQQDIALADVLGCHVALAKAFDRLQPQTVIDHLVVDASLDPLSEVSLKARARPRQPGETLLRREEPARAQELVDLVLRGVSPLAQRLVALPRLALAVG